MEVTFESAKLQKVCSSAATMNKTYGPDCAKRLRIRLAALEAADNVAELFELPGRWHLLRANLTGLVSVDLVHPLRLLIRPVAGDESTEPNELINWVLVTKVAIVGIEDTHEG
jgi:plasmid maintenance system killer protein